MGKNKYNTINKKDNSKLVDTFIIIGIVFLIASLVLMFTKGDKKYIKEISYQEYSEIIDKDEYSIVLLTTPTCSHCLNYKPYVNYAAEEYGLSVYNVDVSKLSEEEYVDIHDKYRSIRDAYNEGKPVIGTPTTLIVKDGIEVDSITGDIGYNGFVNLLKTNKVIK